MTSTSDSDAETQREEDAVSPLSPPAGAGIFLGAMGFSYDEWTGMVYPPGMPKTRRLASYAAQFRLLELDSTYYGTPSPQSVARWADQTPESFTFTAKVPRQITQEARLAGPLAHGETERFIAIMRLLGPRLGPIVFQMSPGFRFPRDFKALKELLEALPSLGGEGLRFAVEFRHPTWLEHKEPEALLREHSIAWVWNDWEPTEKYLEPMPRAIDEPAALRVTSEDFAYLRLTGNHDECIDYRTLSRDRKPDLVRWAELTLEFRRGREARGVYVLLNNHYAGSSPLTIRELERVLDLPVVPFGGPVDPASSPEDPGGQQARLPGF